MPNPTLVTAPAHLPVTMREAKDHLRLEQDDLTADAELWAKIQAATSVAENEAARRFVTQTISWSTDDFPAGDYITLPGGQLRSITSLTYTDSAGTATAWARTNYFASTTHEPGRLHLAYGIQWPSVTLKPADGIVVQYVVGYGTAADMPPAIRAAILLILGDLWENREDQVIGQGFVNFSLPRGAVALLAPYRIYYL